MTEAPAPATHESTEAPKEASGGMPQFDFATWPGQIFWLVIIFVALYALLSSVFLPRVKAAPLRLSMAVAGLPRSCAVRNQC